MSSLAQPRPRLGLPGAGPTRTAAASLRRAAGEGAPVDPDHPRHRAGRAHHAPDVRLRPPPLPDAAEHGRDARADPARRRARARALGAAHRRRGRRGRPRRRPRARRDRDRLRPRARRAARTTSSTRSTWSTRDAAADSRSSTTAPTSSSATSSSRRIPVYAPEWTDHNPSDPGITLIELFAFLGENLLFRFNQIPEATKLAVPAPARRSRCGPRAPPRALVAFTTQTTRRASLVSQRSSGASRAASPFETTIEVVAWPVSARAVGRIQRGGAEAPERTEAYAKRSLATPTGASTPRAAAQAPSTTRPRLLAADPTAPGALAVDFGATVDGTLWVAVLADDRDFDTPRRCAAGMLNIGVVPDDGRARRIDGRRPLPRRAGAETDGHGGRLAGLDRPGSPDGSPRYQRPRAPSGDTTRGLTRQGVVRLELPARSTAVGVFDARRPGRRAAPATCRRARGRELEAKRALLAARLPRDGAQLGRVLLGRRQRRRGRAGQDGERRSSSAPARAGRPAFALVNKPVLAGHACVLEVEEAAGWTPWQRGRRLRRQRRGRPPLRRSTPRRARSRFGNGVRGAAPQIGQRIRAHGLPLRRRRRGQRRRQGDRDADATSSSVKVSNPLPARGGADAETVAAALERIPGELRRHDRAVTAGDFHELALATPGADVGRAECLPRFHPRDARRRGARGVVSVVVWPREDPQAPDAPMPDRPTAATRLRAGSTRGGSSRPSCT